jgi:hypothetical protein
MAAATHSLLQFLIPAVRLTLYFPRQLIKELAAYLSAAVFLPEGRWRAEEKKETKQRGAMGREINE